jgi:hypothetical protein
LIQLPHEFPSEDSQYWTPYPLIALLAPLPAPLHASVAALSAGLGVAVHVVGGEQAVIGV